MMREKRCLYTSGPLMNIIILQPSVAPGELEVFAHNILATEEYDAVEWVKCVTVTGLANVAWSGLTLHFERTLTDS